jgi:hypothetical protein
VGAWIEGNRGGEVGIPVVGIIRTLTDSVLTLGARNSSYASLNAGARDSYHAILTGSAKLRDIVIHDTGRYAITDV